jgi:hypothetical protein
MIRRNCRLLLAKLEDVKRSTFNQMAGSVGCSFASSGTVERDLYGRTMVVVFDCDLSKLANLQPHLTAAFFHNLIMIIFL